MTFLVGFGSFVGALTTWALDLVWPPGEIHGYDSMAFYSDNT